MVEFNDRRETIGSGDFNNPSGTYELVSHGHEDADRWSGMSPHEAKSEVASHYKGQKLTQTWTEANRLAKQRTDHELRKHGMADGAQYANSYQDHLVRVMSLKGPALAEQFGELKHRQSGYGRT